MISNTSSSLLNVISHASSGLIMVAGESIFALLYNTLFFPNLFKYSCIILATVVFPLLPVIPIIFISSFLFFSFVTPHLNSAFNLFIFLACLFLSSLLFSNFSLNFDSFIFLSPLLVIWGNGCIIIFDTSI